MLPKTTAGMCHFTTTKAMLAKKLANSINQQRYMKVNRSARRLDRRGTTSRTNSSWMEPGNLSLHMWDDMIPACQAEKPSLYTPQTAAQDVRTLDAVADSLKGRGCIQI